jgi:REP element-mobilizing transposase RayT
VLHTQARYALTCPVFCLMPDHIHMLWMSLGPGSDQLLAVEFFRKHARPHLHPFEWQRQGYDHVLREKERKRKAFQKTAFYILENPVRAGLVETARDYPYSGTLVVGYPDLDPHAAGFWDRFWRVDAKLRKPLT